jgi:hypothetical protein
MSTNFASAMLHQAHLRNSEIKPGRPFSPRDGELYRLRQAVQFGKSDANGHWLFDEFTTGEVGELVIIKNDGIKKNKPFNPFRIEVLYRSTVYTLERSWLNDYYLEPA